MHSDNSLEEAEVLVEDSTGLDAGLPFQQSATNAMCQKLEKEQSFVFVRIISRNYIK